MIRIRRAMPCAARRRQGRDPAAAADRAAGRRAGPSPPSRSIAGRASRPRARPSPPGSTRIARLDKTFDPRHFLTGARAAYEMIVVAFAQGDRRTLRERLSKDVYDGFDGVIREREGRGETAETRFVSIDTTEVAGAELRARTAQVTVRFVSQLVSVTRDNSGNVTDGNADKVTDVTDVLDLCARRVLARSQLEARGDRSGSLNACPGAGDACAGPRSVTRSLPHSSSVSLASEVAVAAHLGTALARPDAAKPHKVAKSSSRRPGGARRARPDPDSRCRRRADRVGPHRRLGGRRSRGRLRDISGELPPDRQYGESAGREPPDVCGALHAVCRRALEAGTLDSDGGAQVLRGQFPSRPHRQARRCRRIPHRLLRADRRRLALSDRAIFTCRSTAGRPTCCRRPARASRRGLSQHRPVAAARRDRQARALLRPRRDRGRRARRPASRDLLDQGCRPRRCSSRFRARRASGSRTA